jgi:hypothetical protein
MSTPNHNTTAEHEVATILRVQNHISPCTIALRPAMHEARYETDLLSPAASAPATGALAASRRGKLFFPSFSRIQPQLGLRLHLRPQNAAIPVDMVTFNQRNTMHVSDARGGSLNW